MDNDMYIVKLYQGINLVEVVGVFTNKPAAVIAKDKTEALCTNEYFCTIERVVINFFDLKERE
jgi:hypothetical protein